MRGLIIKALTDGYDINNQFSYKKKQYEPLSKIKKIGKNLSPRNRKACHSIRNALLQSITEIGTQSTMKSSRKTLHELTPNVPPKRRKGTELHSSTRVRTCIMLNIS
jgi:hypothetical protein